MSSSEPSVPAPSIVGTGKRLKARPTALLADTAFAHELDGVEWLWSGMNHADMAQLIELVRIEAIPVEVAAELAGSLVEFENMGHASIDWDPVLGDIYNNRSAHLKAAGVVGIDWLHAGRARREATTIAWQIACRRELTSLAESVVDLVNSLCDGGEAEARTVCPSYTYWQVAQPTTLGHYLLSFAGPLLRDLDRIRAAIDRANASPAGGGSTSGTSIPISRQNLADLLGFDSLVQNTRDAMWQHDLAIELGYVACSVASTIDRLAEDLSIWSTAEFDFFDCHDGHARTSVIMPQKKNPYGLAYLRGAARTTSGSFQEILSTQFLSTGHPDSRTTAYIVAPTVLRRVAQMCALTTEILQLGEFNRVQLERSATANHAYASDLCDWLTQTEGYANRVAHDVVGRAVRAAIEGGHSMVDDRHMADAAAELSVARPTTSVAEWAERYGALGLVDLRTSTGGASQDAITDLLDDFRQDARRHSRAISVSNDRMKMKQKHLRDEVEKLSRHGQ